MTTSGTSFAWISLADFLLRNSAIYYRKEVLLTSLLDFQEPDSLCAWFWTVNGSSQFQFRSWPCCRKPLEPYKVPATSAIQNDSTVPSQVQQNELCLCPLTLQSDYSGQVKRSVHWRESHCGCLSVQDVSSGQCQSYNSTLWWKQPLNLVKAFSSLEAFNLRKVSLLRAGAWN